jgi:hypothetical protein
MKSVQCVNRLERQLAPADNTQIRLIVDRAEQASRESARAREEFDGVVTAFEQRSKRGNSRPE